MNISIKTIARSLLFLFYTMYPQSPLPYDPHKALVAVVIMVKDEVDVIVPTLQPLIDGGIDAVLVYDTGSTDGTQHKAASYFKENKFEHGHIIEEPFIDFATSRNKALDLAEEVFPNVTFFLMLDAEWYMYNVEDLVQFCKENEHYIAPGMSGGCYSIKLITLQDGIDNYVPRLIRRDKHARYTGVVHESIRQPSSGCAPKTVFFEYLPKEAGREKTKKRCWRDYQLLKKSLENDPTNTRTLFYLAQTCQFIDEWEQAIYYYHKRAEYGDVSEECYLALYRIACAIEHIIYVANHNNEPCNYRWEDALSYYLGAHNMLPHRAEPLIRIAQHYLYNKHYAIAYLFAHRAAALPYPINDVLFVEKKLYEFSRYDILGQCALYVGAHTEGKNAVLKAIEAYPEEQHLYHNLSVYTQCIS